MESKAIHLQLYEPKLHIIVYVAAVLKNIMQAY